MTFIAGDDHPHRLISDAKREEIRRLYACGLTQERLARRFGVSRGCIKRIVARRRRG